MKTMSLPNVIAPTLTGSVISPSPSELEGPALRVDELLKAPHAVLHDIEHDVDLAARTRTYVQVLIACAAAFGASLGFYRGGVQILFATIKLPLVMLVTLAVVAPLLHTLNRALERPASMARDVAFLVAGFARGGLVLAAELPLVWAAHALGIGYHRFILLAVATCGIAGAVTFSFLWRALSFSKPGRGLVTAVVLATLVAVGAQATWLFRPFLVRPRATSVVFVHPLEGSFSDSIGDSLDSARGVYRGDRTSESGL
jgi:hypothetical protein